MNIKFLLLATVSVAVIALDQLTKMYIHTQFGLGESLPIVQDFFHITYVRNYGAAFGFLAQSEPVFRETFFLALPPVALIIILFLLKDVDPKDRWQILGFSLVFGGAIGNYIDRVRFRYVIDFLDFHYKNVYSFPAFNVADSAIVVGVGLLMVLMFLEQRSENAAKVVSES